MKKRTSDWHLLLPQLLAALIRSPGALRIGCSGDAGQRRVVLVDAGKSGTPRPLGWGTGIPMPLRMLLPMTVYADLGMVPVHAVSVELDGEDPDVWIDRNEERLTPAGFTADRIVTEVEVENDTLYAATVVAEARDRAVAQCDAADLPAVALLPPLAGLAVVYGTQSGKPCVLWYVNEHGSIIGRIERGRVTGICHFWADTNALASDPAGVTSAAKQLAESLHGTTAAGDRYILSTEELPQFFAAAGPRESFTPAPGVVKGLPQSFYSAYGNAWCGHSAINLLPFHLRQRRVRVQRAFTTTVTMCRGVFLLLMLLCGIAGSYIGVSRLLLLRDRNAMKTINRQYEQLTSAEHARDSLKKVFRQQSGLIGSESSVTRLLNDLQVVFPDGVKAEEITVTEHDAASWKLTIRAFTVSSSLLQPTVDNLQNVPGCGAVRVVYSEKVSGKKDKTGIRFKLETEWK